MSEKVPSPNAEWYQIRDSDNANGHLRDLVCFEHSSSLSPSTQHFVKLCGILVFAYIDLQADFPIGFVDMDSTTRIGDYLHSNMANTQYLSLRGQQRNITALFTNYSAYYKSLSTNDRFGTYGLCLLAMFLNISPDELIHMQLPRKRQQDIFDTEIRRLHKQGLNYAEIARRLNASYYVVKSIGNSKFLIRNYCNLIIIKIVSKNNFCTLIPHKNYRMFNTF